MIALPSVRISKAAVQTWEKNHKKAVKKKKKKSPGKKDFIKKKILHYFAFSLPLTNLFFPFLAYSVTNKILLSHIRLVLQTIGNLFNGYKYKTTSQY